MTVEQLVATQGTGIPTQRLRRPEQYRSSGWQFRPSSRGAGVRGATVGDRGTARCVGLPYGSRKQAEGSPRPTQVGVYMICPAPLPFGKVSPRSASTRT